MTATPPAATPPAAAPPAAAPPAPGSGAAPAPDAPAPGALTETGDVMRLLVRGRWRLGAGLLAGLLLSTVVLLLTDTRFTATSYLVVVPVGQGAASDAANFGKVFARVASDLAVVEKAPHLESIGMTPLEARRASTVTASPDAPVLEVRAQGPTAFRSAEIANFVGQGIVIYADERAQDTGYLLRQFVRATPPPEPSAPRPLLLLAVGAALGVAVGVVAALSSRRRSSAEDLEPGGPEDGGDLWDTLPGQR
jgi:hypothetical protein